MKKTLSALLGAAAIMGATATPAFASVAETREFVGYGSSKVGLALYYAREDARRQAERAGFTDCEEYFQFVSPYDATVFWRCTR